MDVEAGNGEILRRWQAERSVLDVEITVGHVWMRFTGRVTSVSNIELVLSHPQGELSISLFFAGAKLIEPRDGSQADYWKTYRRALQISTDGGAVCTISDPAILLKFLDGFLTLAEDAAADDALCNALLDNQAEIERLQLDIKRIPEIEKLKRVADDQVETLKRQKAGEVVELEQKLAREKAFRSKLETNLSTLLTSIKDGLSSEELAALVEELDGSTLAVGKDEYAAVKKLVEQLALDVDTVAAGLKVKVREATDKLTAQMNAWVAKEQETRAKIEDLRRGLEKQNIKLDMAFIRKVTADATNYATLLEKLKKSVPEHKEARRQRRALIGQRKSVRGRIFTTRQAFASTMTTNLASCVVDYSVHIRFHEGVLSTELEELVKEAMGWRTSQVPKAAILAAHLSPLGLAAAIEAKDPTVIERIKHDDRPVFSRSEADGILTTLREWSTMCAIERCPFEDRPEIKVTKTVILPGGGKAYSSAANRMKRASTSVIVISGGTPSSRTRPSPSTRRPLAIHAAIRRL